MLDTLLRKELENRNIKLDYSFWLKSVTHNTVLFHKAALEKGELLPANTYQTTLFSQDVIRDPGMLYVNFPDKESMIFNNLGVTMRLYGRERYYVLHFSARSYNPV